MVSRHVPISAAVLAFLPATVLAQGTAQDYQRSAQLEDLYEGLVVNVVEEAAWSDSGDRLVFRRSVEGGHRFLSFDLAARQERPAFDHDRLADALTRVTGEPHRALELPLDDLELAGADDAVRFSALDARWECDLASYQCVELEEEDRGEPGAGNDEAVPSPDGRYEAFIHNHNVAIREMDSGEVEVLSMDGSEGNAYRRNTIRWAPDSRRLAAYRVIPGYERLVHYVESSPDDQLQPLHHTRSYTKPGDVLDVRRPVLFDLESNRQVVVEDSLFPNAYKYVGDRVEGGRSRLPFRVQSARTRRRVIGIHRRRGHGDVERPLPSLLDRNEETPDVLRDALDTKGVFC